MTESSQQHRELIELLEALCEDRLSESSVVRLEQLVLSDGAARRFYVNYLALHGSLAWDGAHTDEMPEAQVAPNSRFRSLGR